MSSSYRVLKLQSGEESIAKIKGREGKKIILEKPMIFTTQMRSTPFGQTQEITFLKDWLANINKDTIKIPENFIVTWNLPSNDVSRLYDAERNNKPKTKMGGNKEKLDEIKYLDKLLEDLNKLEDQINDQEKNMQQPPMPMDNPNNGIFMSMMLPPDFIKILLDEGYLDLDDMGFEEGTGIDGFYEEINDHEYTGDQVDDPNYGNRLDRDWETKF